MTVFRSFFDISDMGIKMAAATLIIIATLYNLVGVKLAAFIQSLSMVAKLVPVLLIMGVALFVGTATPDWSFGSAQAYGS